MNNISSYTLLKNLVDAWDMKDKELFVRKMLQAQEHCREHSLKCGEGKKRERSQNSGVGNLTVITDN
jgi:hypothetical protein